MGGLDLVLLWCRPLATAPIPPLAWEPQYAAGVALKKQKKKKKSKKKKKKQRKKLMQGREEILTEVPSKRKPEGLPSDEGWTDVRWEWGCALMETRKSAGYEHSLA